MNRGFFSYYQRSSTAFNDFILLVGVAILTYGLARTIDLFELAANWLKPYEPIQLDELLVTLAILAVALGVFSVRRWREVGTEVARRRKLQAELAQALSQTGQNQAQIAGLNHQLQAERDTLETIMENTPAHLAYLDLGFNFVRVNVAYAQGSGHTQADLIGHNHFDLFPNPENRAIFEQVSTTGQPVQFQAKPFEYPDQPDRGVTYWNWSLVPVKDAAGQVQGVVLSLLDVTERKRMENALQQARADLEAKMELALAEREQAYLTLAENLPGIVYRVFVREGHRMEFFNKLARSVIGYTVEELTTGQVCSLEPLILPKDRAAVVTTVEQAVAENKPFTVEYRLKHKDGSLKYLIEQGQPIYGSDGLPLYIDGVIFDITERKAAEAMVSLQAQIIDQIHDSVISTDLDGYVTSWNQGAVRLTDYSVAEALGRHISFLYAEDQQDYLQREVIAPLKARGSHETEAKMQNKAGRVFYVHLSLSLLRNEVDVPFGMIGYSVDITARKQAEEAMARYIRRLEILRKLDQAMLTPQSLGEIAEAALRYIRQLLDNCQRASVVLNDIEAGQALWLAVTGVDKSELPPERRTSLEFLGPITDLSEKEFLLVDDIQAKTTLAGIDRTLLAQGIRSYLCLPFFYQNRMIGSLNLSSINPQAFSEEDIQVGRQIADRLAVALQKSRLFEQVEAGQARLQALSRRLVNAQEDERRRLARELHDEIGQALTAIKLNLQGLQRLPDGADLKSRLDDSIDIADRVLQQVRHLSLDLRPSLLDDLGLAATLRWFLDRQAQWGGFSTQFIVEPAELDVCTELQTTYFRIVQEALTNVMRHAQAHHVQVELHQQADELELTVQDDGVGFDVQAALDRAAGGASLGLLSMQERVASAGGQLDLESRPGHGTKLRVCCPRCSAG